MFQSLHEMVFLSFDSLIMRGAGLLSICVCAIQAHSNSHFETFFAIFYTEDFESCFSRICWFPFLNSNVFKKKIFFDTYTKWYFEREDKRFTKGSFFWDQIQDMSSSGLPIRKVSDWLTYLVHQLDACVFWRETTWSHVLTDVRKNWL